MTVEIIGTDGVIAAFADSTAEIKDGIISVRTKPTLGDDPSRYNPDVLVAQFALGIIALGWRSK